MRKHRREELRKQALTVLSIQRLIPGTTIKPIRSQHSALPHIRWTARQLMQLQVRIPHEQAWQAQG